MNINEMNHQNHPFLTKKTMLIFTLVLLCMFCFFSFIATQCLAYFYHFQLLLGAKFYGWLYLPWKWINWSFTWESMYPKTFEQAYFVAGMATFLVFSIGFRLIYRFRKNKIQAVEGLHGSARFAKKEEIIKMSLLENDGVYIGGYQPNKKKKETYYLRHDGPEHLIAFAPTRSGKGVDLVIPTLLSWAHSVVVFDIKGENYALTSGWRHQYAHNKILKFNPGSPEGDSVKFNPLDEIRLDTKYEVADIQNIVSMIVDPDGKGLNDHWAKTGHALLTGAILHLLYMVRKETTPAHPPTLHGLSELLSNPNKTIDEVLEHMRTYPHMDNETTHPLVASCARDMMNKASHERSSVLSTAMSFLTLYRDEIVSENTASSDFKISDLMNDDKPVSLYLVITPNELVRLKPLIRLIINQIMRTLTAKMTFENGRSVKNYKHRLLMLLDEFTALGKLDIFQESLAFIAGYGIKAYIIIQDLAQLYNHYGKNESIVSNCHVRIAYAPNNIQTAELLSKMTGITTQIKNKKSNSGKRSAWALTQVSESWEEVSRPLMTIDEVGRIPGIQTGSNKETISGGNMLIFLAGHYPIYGKQILFFQDSVFSARSRVPAFVNSKLSLLTEEKEKRKDSDDCKKMINKEITMPLFIDKLKTLIKKFPINENDYFFIVPSQWNDLFYTELALSLFEWDKNKIQLFLQNLGILSDKEYEYRRNDTAKKQTTFCIYLDFEPQCFKQFTGYIDEKTTVQNHDHDQGLDF